MATTVLLHGLGDTAAVWWAVLGALTDGREKVLVDLPGHGLSDWCSPIEYSTARMAGAVLELCEQQGLTKINLVGHSLGAEIALKLAARRPNLIEQIVLIDYCPDISDEVINALLALLQEAYRRYDSVGFYASVLKTRHPAGPEWLLDVIATHSLRQTKDGLWPAYDPTMLRPIRRPLSAALAEQQVLWSLFARINCPCLMIRGAGSSIVSKSAAQRFADITNCRVRVVSGAGHCVHIDNPAGLVAALRESAIDGRL